MQGNTHTDTQLEAMLTEPGLWLVRGAAVTPAPNLQSALLNAFDQSMAGHVVQLIVKMPDDQVIIDAHQIHRLWQLFRIRDRFGNQVGGTRV